MAGAVDRIQALSFSSSLTDSGESALPKSNALSDGLRVHFTGPVDETAASAPTSYTIRSYRRVSTPAYGGNDQEERQETVLAAKVFANGTAVDLTLANLRADTVYELRVGKVAPSHSSRRSSLHHEELPEDIAVAPTLS